MKNLEMELDKKAQAIINKDILHNATSLVEFIFSKDQCAYNSVENDYEYFYDEIRNEEEESPKEILEWWLVAERLYESLRELKECVFKHSNLYFWGRTCSGQAIILDGTIQQIIKKREGK